MIRAARKDANHKEIVEVLRGIGAYVLDTAQLKHAFDLLVGFKGRLFIMEIKDGTKPPSQRKLTDGELKCKRGFNGVNVNYYVVNSVEEALLLINY